MAFCLVPDDIHVLFVGAFIDSIKLNLQNNRWDNLTIHYHNNLILVLSYLINFFILLALLH